MKEFSIIPKIVQMDSAEEFCRTYQIGKGDLFFVSGHMYERFFKENTEGACVVNYRNYASGEPTDLMVEGIYKDIQGAEYDRVIAVGGGTDPPFRTRDILLARFRKPDGDSMAFLVNHHPSKYGGRTGL